MRRVRGGCKGYCDLCLCNARSPSRGSLPIVFRIEGTTCSLPLEIMDSARGFCAGDGCSGSEYWLFHLAGETAHWGNYGTGDGFILRPFVRSTRGRSFGKRSNGLRGPSEQLVSIAF